MLIVSSFVHFYLQLVFSSISTLSLKLYLLKDEACPLIKERRSKRMDIQRQTLAKSSIIQFHHLLTNKQWLVHFKILYISSTFTNITMLFMKSISLESAIINFVLLWNVWFSKMFCKIHWGNIFFHFDVFFLIRTTYFAYFFISMLRTTKNKAASIASAPLILIDWLIWLVHQFWLVH